MDVEIVRRVCLARHLYGLAKDNLDSSNELYLFSAVNLLQDSVEAFLLAVSDFVGAPIDSRTTFDKYFVEINKKIAPQELPFKNPLLRLNKIRVNSKHHGIQPSKQEVERLEVNVNEFFIESCTSILGCNFNTVSAIDLLNDGETKDVLVEARDALEKTRLDECAILCRKAIYLEIEQAYDISRFRADAPPRGLLDAFGPTCKAPYYAQSSEYIERNVKDPTDYIVYDQIHLHQELSTLKVDGTSFWNLWRLTPDMYRGDDLNWYVKDDFDKLDYRILEDKIQYIYDTTLNIVYSIHKVRNTVQTSKFQRYHVILEKDKAPIYEKAHLGSKVIEYTPEGAHKVDVDYSIVGLIGDGPFWHVSDIINKKFVSGFIHNDYLKVANSEDEFHYGNVKWFDESKGYGFIAGDDGDEVFFHHSEILDGDPQNLKPNQRVQYVVAEARKGPKAVRITILSTQ